ncbi:hypothetical protein H0H93_007208, partial [Arthromyces matolae]
DVHDAILALATMDRCSLPVSTSDGLSERIEQAAQNCRKPLFDPRSANYCESCDWSEAILKFSQRLL